MGYFFAGRSFVMISLIGLITAKGRGNDQHSKIWGVFFLANCCRLGTCPPCIYIPILGQ